MGQNEAIQRFLNENPGYEARWKGVLKMAFDQGAALGEVRARLDAFAQTAANLPGATVTPDATGKPGIIELPFGDGNAFRITRRENDWIPEVVKIPTA